MPWPWEKAKKASKRYGPRKKVTLDEALEQAVVHKAQKDKGWALNKALKKLGLEDESPVEQQKQEIKTTLITEALKQIRNDPKLLQRFTEKQIEEIVGEASAGEGEGSFGSSISQVLEEIEDFEALREKLGGKEAKGLINDLLNTETFKGIGQSLVEKLLGGLPGIQKTYVVRVDGQLREVTETQYRELEAQGLLKPIAAIEAPKEPPEAPKEPEEPESKEREPEHEPEAEFELPAFLSAIDLDAIVWMLDWTPEDFVAQLEVDLESEVPYARFLWDFLPKTDYATIMKHMEPYRTNSQVGIYVERLLSDEGGAWLEEVIKLIKEKIIGEEPLA